MLFHALFVPAFEGPDEPFHLARVLAFAREPLAEAFAGSRIEADVQDAIRSLPCSSGLHAAFGCPGFGAAPAAFDVLGPGGPGGPGSSRSTPNPEDNQPPLFYLLAGLPLRMLPRIPSPLRALLYLRLLCVACVAAAILGPLRRLGRERPAGLAAGFLLLLSTPGAAEALARASNDAAVFLWSAAVVDAVDRRPRAATIVALLAIGPLLKATALPVVAFAVVALIGMRLRRVALGGALASLIVFPLQLLRSWQWGGGLEFNRVTHRIPDGPVDLLTGLARSAYTFAKTTFWLGEWSFFRAPVWLVLSYFALIAFAVLCARRRPESRRLTAHAVGVLVAAVGFAAVAAAKRPNFGGWGGVGGWYVWSWLPWLALAADDSASLARPFASRVLVAQAAFVVASNAAWLSAAWRLYGVPRL
jgi:hypothetical protein